MNQNPRKIDFKSWILTPKRRSLGRPICAMIGIAATAALYRLGYLSAEPTMLSGIAYAALGAIAGLLVYGVYDMARKVL
jgi:hypothetical protein